MSEQTPTLAVVIPSVNGWSDLEGCIAALERERASVPLDVLVPERCGADVQSRLSARFPWVRAMPVLDTVTSPQMRAKAFYAASAPTGAVIEDHVIVPSGWARRMLDARRNG